MKINKKALLAAVVLPVLITACSAQNSNSEESVQVITPQDLQHHNWNLAKIDGQMISVEDKSQTPRLEVGENMTVNGNAGCNNYFGQGELEDGKFRVKQMGMTMKMCGDDAMNIEMSMSKTLSDWSEMTLTKESLVLKGSEHTLTFKLRDWVN
jgi:heat shock protein HslJ